jgi:hypothetical protein
VSSFSARLMDLLGKAPIKPIKAIRAGLDIKTLK